MFFRPSLLSFLSEEWALNDVLWLDFGGTGSLPKKIVLRVLIMIFYLILLVHMYSFWAFLSWIRIRIQIRIYEADPDPDSGKKSDLDPEKNRIRNIGFYE